MAERSGGATVAKVAAREWWVVALSTVAAVSVTFAVAGGGLDKAGFEGRGVIAIDALTVSRTPGLPSADRVIGAADTSRFRTSVSRRTGVPVDEVAANMSVYSLEAPPRQLVVTFEAEEATPALSAAASATAQVLDLARALGGSVTGVQRARVRRTEEALREVSEIAEEAGTRASEATLELGLVATRWEMRLSLLSDRDLLRQLENAYSWDGETTVRRLPPSRSGFASLAGGALIGLVLGSVIAVLREARFARVDRVGAHGEY